MAEIGSISSRLRTLAAEAEEHLKGRFASIDETAFYNTQKVLSAFQNERVEESCFAGTTGYGYDDRGREVLDKIYARVFGCESALVRTQFANGTHAITCALFACLAPGDVLLAATGRPYDTLQTAIGLNGSVFGSLKYYGIEYRETALTRAGKPDYDAIAAAAADPRVKAVEVQRSRGYSTRPSLSMEEIGRICDVVHKANPSAVVIADNCYGEFTKKTEPTQHGVDLIAGSLIKNPGGGLAPCGGYVAGRKELVDRAAQRLTSPGIGGEVGATLNANRALFQGFFVAPHVTAQAMKTALFCAEIMKRLGYEVSPEPEEFRSDIIQTVIFRDPEALKRFCRGIQAGSPVDSFVAPEPWAMPGYDSEVIMAAGAFIQGSSIELSADGPMREPYTAYLQGGITYESGKIGVLLAAQYLLET